MPNIKNNKTVQRNKVTVETANYEFILKNKRLPTYQELCKATGLSLMTVFKYMQDLDFDKDSKQRLKPLSEKVMLSVGMRAIKTGKSPEAKFFMEVIEDHTTKIDAKVEGIVTIADLIQKAAEYKKENES